MIFVIFFSTVPRVCLCVSMFFCSVCSTAVDWYLPLLLLLSAPYSKCAARFAKATCEIEDEKKNNYDYIYAYTQSMVCRARSVAEFK